MQGNTHTETHFKVFVVAAQFEGLKLIERHRMVNEILAEEMDRESGGTVHALSIKAKSPDQYEKLSNNQLW